MLRWSTCILIFGISICGAYVEARIDLEISRDGGGSNFSNNFAAAFSHDARVSKKEIVGLNNYLQYTYANSKSTVGLNSNLSDFEIISNSQGLNYSISFYEALTLTAHYEVIDYNERQAMSTRKSFGLYWQLKRLQFGINLGSAQSKQLSDVIILTRDVKEQIMFNQKSAEYYLDYQIINSVLLKISGAYYSYDENLNDFNTLLTSIVFLDRAGPAMASEVQGQIRNSASIGASYALDDYWMLEVGLTRMQDYLEPKSCTNGVELNISYEAQLADTGTYKVYGALSGANTEDIDGNMYSGLLGLGISF